MMEKAIFIDKDGTLVENVPYNIDPEKIRIYEDVPEAIRMLKRNGFKIVVVTNQPGISLGYFKEEDFKKSIQAFYHMFEDLNADLNGFYYCPHHPHGKISKYVKECSCRKPMPGMIIRASIELNIDLSKSWMIGDILNDVESGKRAGCKTIHIDNGNETEWVLNSDRKPLYTLKKVIAAATKIIWHEEMQAEKIKRGDLYEGPVEKFNRRF
jgi:D-glycero-D-manno-heptose 1,7-bisphosphate phosphatase